MNEKVKKKILYMVTKSSWGGAQKYVYDLAVANKHEYEVVVACGRNEFDSDNIFVSRLTESGIKTLHIEGLTRNVGFLSEFKTLRELYGIVKKESPDVLHLNSVKIGGLGGLVGRYLGIPQILFSTHGLAFFEDRAWWQKRVIEVASFVICLLAHTNISVSKREYEYMRNVWRFPASKVVQIYNGITLPKYQNPLTVRSELVLQTTDQKTKEYLADPRTVWMTSIGELTENKGYSYLLQALRELKDRRVPFIFSHYGDGVLKKKLVREAHDLDLQEHIIWNGFDPAAANKITGYDIFVLPSVKEGLGYVLLEAGGASIACIGSRVGGIPEVITNQETGLLVAPKDVLGIADAVETLQDMSLRSDYGSALAEHIHENFSIKNMI